MPFRTFFRLSTISLIGLGYRSLFANAELGQRRTEEELRIDNKMLRSSESNEKWNDTIFNRKVKIELYYMPQCPGCRQLLSTSFYDAFHTEGFPDMADVTFVPYGNARESEEGHRVFDNVLESCALHYIGSAHQDQQFQYIDCIDHHAQRQNPETASMVDIYCAKAIGLKPNVVREINRCAASEEGHSLSRRNIQQSNSLTPKMTYFPWIVVDTIHDDGEEDALWRSLFNYVCRLYTGPKRSPHCPPIMEIEGDIL